MNAGFRIRPAGRVAERRRRRAGFETEIDSAIWSEAARAAIAFRGSAGADRRISTAFRTMCKENTKPLHMSAQRAARTALSARYFPELPIHIIPRRLLYFFPGIHHERPVRDDRLAYRVGMPEQQHGVRVGDDVHAVAIIA